MDALRMAAGTLSAGTDADAARLLVGSFPTIVAAYSRLVHGSEPLAPRGDLGLAANYLYMLTGAEPQRGARPRARRLSRDGRRITGSTRRRSRHE